MQTNDLAFQSRNLTRWLVFALLSLLAANVLAIFLVALKTPVINSPQALPYFRALLAYHVNLAMVFWMPCVAIWLWSYFCRLPVRITNLAFVLSSVAALLFLFSLFDIDHQVSLSNYYPILHSKLFIAALVTQLCACTLVVFSVLLSTTTGAKKSATTKSTAMALFLYRSAALIWPLLLTVLLGNYLILSPELSQDAYFEALLWGPGHIQQTLNALLIAAMWSFFLKNEKVLPILRVSVWLSIGSCVLATVLQFYLTESQLQRQLFTLQMSAFSWLPMLAVGSCFLKEKTSASYVKWSLLVALMGLIAGGFIVRGTLSVPGHYHGMTGAFNLAFFAIIASLYRKSTPYQVRLSVIYGAGVVLLICGLMWAGELDIGRKLVAYQQGDLSVWQFSAIACITIGATLGVGSSILIIKNFIKQVTDTYE